MWTELVKCSCLLSASRVLVNVSCSTNQKSRSCRLGLARSPRSGGKQREITTNRRLCNRGVVRGQIWKLTSEITLYIVKMFRDQMKSQMYLVAQQFSTECWQIYCGTPKPFHYKHICSYDIQAFVNTSSTSPPILNSEITIDLHNFDIDWGNTVTIISE